MRVLELTDLYRPAIGGLERFVSLLAESLIARGHDVHIVTAAVPGQPDLEREGQATVHRIPLSYQRLRVPLAENPARPFHPPWPDPTFAHRLKRIIERVRPDVIHAHSWSIHSALRPPGSLGYVPVLATAHDYGLVCAKKSLTLPAGEPCTGPSPRRCVSCASAQYGHAKGSVLAVTSNAGLRRLRHVATFSAVSDYVSRRLTPILEPLTGKPVQTLHSFVPDGLYDLGWASAAPSYLPSAGHSQGAFVLYAGQLSKHKGLDVLLDAYRRLPLLLSEPMSKEPPALVLLGTTHPSFPIGPGLPDRAIVRTDVPHSEIIAAMVRAACVVVPSRWSEPLPMTVSEAHNCGVPTVASKVGGIPEQLVDGRTGYLVPSGDPTALAARIADVLRNPQRARLIGAAARVRGREFTASAGVLDVERALRETVSGYSASQPEASG